MREKRSRLSLDNIVKLVQIASILSAAIWAVFEYLSFRKQNNEAVLAQQELSLAAANITLASSSIARDQAEIDLAKSRNQRITADVTFDIEFKRKIDESLNQYQVFYGLRVTNISDEEIEISYEVTEFFLGDLIESAPSQSIFAINNPTFRPSRQISFSSHKGAVEWTKIGAEAYVYPSAKSTIESLLSDLDFSNNGLVTSVLGPGETSFGNREYMVIGKPGQYVSFGTTFGINRAVSGPEVWIYSGTGDLEDPS